MKMKKLVIKLFILGILVHSCSENYLDTTPKDFITPATFLENEAQVEILLNGVYHQLDFGGTNDADQKLNPFVFDNMTDNSVDLQPWHGTTAFAKGGVPANNKRVRWKWKRNYQGIARANTFIDLVSESPIESDKIPRYFAEAKFLRAWYYHDLVMFYGDVPLLLGKPDLADGQPSRTPKAEVITQILKDLDEAIPVLPLSYTGNEKGKITKGAAIAFKARVLLFEERWNEAAAVAKECMDLGVYSLFSDYEGLFLEVNESAVSDSEAILEVFYTPNVNASFFQTPIMEWWPMVLPSLSMAEAYYMDNGLPITDPSSGYDPDNPYMNRDPRLYASIYYPGAPWRVEFWGRTAPDNRFQENWILGGTGFKPKKWMNDGKQMDRWSGEGNNKIFLRYAEVLLTYAEAKNEASGPDASVYAAVDELRTRIGMTTLTDAMPGLSQAEMREVIRNERRVEFIYEGLRLNDIRRWKIGEEVMVDSEGYDHTYLKDQSYPGDGMGTTADWQYVRRIVDIRSFVAPRDYLWPIPQEEMDSNPNMTQNPGY